LGFGGLKNIFATRKALANAALVSALSVAAIGVLAPTANAYYRSNTWAGCYSTWGNTGTNAHCNDPWAAAQDGTSGGNEIGGQSGDWANHALCDFESDMTSSRSYFYYLHSYDNFGQLDCTFNVTGAYPIFYDAIGDEHHQ